MAKRPMRARRKTGLAAIVLLLGVAAFFLIARTGDTRDAGPVVEPDVPTVPLADEVLQDRDGAALPASPKLPPPGPVDDPRSGAAPKTGSVVKASTAPTIDVARIDATGSSVIAGRSAPDTRISIRVDGFEVAEAQSDPSGAFVALFDIPPVERPQLLSVGARDANGDIEPSRQDLIVAPAAPAVPDASIASGGIGIAAFPEVATGSPEVARSPLEDVAVGEDRPAGRRSAAGASGEMADRNVRVAAAEGPFAPGSPGEAESIPVAAAIANPEEQQVIARPVARNAGSGIERASRVTGTEGAATPRGKATVPPPVSGPGTVAGRADHGDGAGTVLPAKAPRVFHAGPDGLRLVASDRTERQVDGVLRIDAISYDMAGDVEITGRAGTGETLRLHIDDAPVLETRAGADGVWASPLPGVRSGIHRLRVDAIAADGTVIARVETPFQRTAPDVAAAARRAGLEAITVQPGYTLWAISKGYFGSGTRYVQIFEANRTLIRDPDLIYPGQVFALPARAPD